MWLFSLKGLTIFALFVCPLLIIVTPIVFATVIAFIGMGTIVYTLIKIIVYIVYITMLIVYPLIPIVYSSERYFRKRGYENTVIENERVKRIIYLSLPFFVLGFSGFLAYMDIGIGGSLYTILIHRLEDYNIPSDYIIAVLWTIGTATLVFASALLKTTFLTSKREFSFYYAKACMKLVSKKEDDDEKMRYLIEGIKSYNAYLSKQFRCQIDYFKIYSKIINSPAKERMESIKLVTEAFDEDKLAVVNYLTRCLEDDKEQILPANSFGDRLQYLGTYLGGIIGAIAGIIGSIAGIIGLFPKH